MFRLNLSGVSNAVRTLGTAVRRNAPTIMTIAGTAGMVGTVVLAVKQTPKALELIEEAKMEKGVPVLTKKEVVKTAYKPMLPVIACGTASIALVMGGHYLGIQALGAAVAAAKFYEEKGIKYKESVKSVLTPKQEAKVKEEIRSTQLQENPVDQCNIPSVNGGNHLIFEPITSRYFRSSEGAIKEAVTNLNIKMLEGFGSASLNEFFKEIGLDECYIGDYMGWDINKHHAEISCSPGRASNGEPCFVLEYETYPFFEERGF